MYEYKVGDWVELKAYGTGNVTGSVNSNIVQLLEIDNSKNPSGNLPNGSHFMVKVKAGYRTTNKMWIIRLALPHEIPIEFRPKISKQQKEKILNLIDSI